ncbi:SRPBCC family protein [Blastopirellula marina]|uniref:Uncharacterized protein n=1 Tax=Blastopirellula marina DSM 3645 TaxID=314230 RepID=A3ZWD4_9BACT|nr:hypothetical protein [Blastopirellula marina]EAQ79162.1 hypothetical protein DSM3645_26104 [Blastopirellula marina DSM 3645]
MTRSTKNIVTLIAVIALVVSLSTQSEAGGCHSSRGGHGFSQSLHHNQLRSQYQHQHTYRRPTYVAPRQPIAPPQQFSQQPISQPGQPFDPGQPQQQAPQGQSFAQGQPQPQQQAPAAQPQPAAPTTGSANAEISALEALGGFAPPQAESTTPVAENNALPAHVGRWSSTLGNGARIQLDLNANGSFNWSAANKDGGTSSFQGTYEITNGSLTLIRSTDNQKLAGSLETNGNDAFSFQLADQKAAKLEFVRA